MLPLKRELATSTTPTSSTSMAVKTTSTAVDANMAEARDGKTGRGADGRSKYPGIL
jgi:hypothetical protein